MGVYVDGVTLEASCKWHFEEQQWPYADHFQLFFLSLARAKDKDEDIEGHAVVSKNPHKIALCGIFTPRDMKHVVKLPATAAAIV